jgi:NAD(P)-dependent dehydrogenase (short-subunit alcohol dehydrogenase family)
MEKVWLITGCSTGFGRELALLVLKSGHQVAVAARNVIDVEDIVRAYPAKALAVTLDVTKPKEIKSAVAQVKQKCW